MSLSLRFIPDTKDDNPSTRYSMDSKADAMATADTRMSKQRIAIALHDYNSRESVDVSFTKGDVDSGWELVIHMSNQEKGPIPRNPVPEEQSDEVEEWLFEQVSRYEADELLLAEENPRGTFLVRPSDQNLKGYTLFVKDFDDDQGYHVKHYKIEPQENGGFYIAADQPFGSLQELVDAHKKDAMAICHVLMKACPKPLPNTRDQLEIDHNDLQLITVIGKGNFGEIYYGKWGTKEVAVKMLREGTMTKDAFLREADIMKNLRHKNLVALHAVCSKEKPILIVQEFMCNGSLLEFLRHGDGKKWELEDLINIAAQVGSGMKYLESRMVIHCDLAARNVLMGKNNIAKICEFGRAGVITNDLNRAKQGTLCPVKWTALEAILFARFSIKSDVWSFGILLMELFTYGQIPYPGMSGSEVIEALQKGYRMPLPASPAAPLVIYKLMLSCWDEAPEKRPTFDFLSHYFETFTVASDIA